MTWLLTTVALIGVLSLGDAWGDIVEWQDANGTRHFSNCRDQTVPDGQLRVVVSEKERSDSEPREVPAASEPARRAEVVYGHSRVVDAYVEGLEEGLALAERAEVGGFGVQISGPLAVATAAGGEVPMYVPYTPFVTSSFDRGRSRHLTLRMLLQDQFQLDRDGPFGYERFPVGRGVALQPFLSRGLPQRFPYGRRVLLR